MDTSEGSDTDQENNNTSNWTTSQQRKLCYRTLLNKVEDLQEAGDVTSDTAQQVGEIIKEMNAIESTHNITRRYQYPDETFLDTMVLSATSDILVKCVKAIDLSDHKYDFQTFVANTQSFCVNGEEDNFNTNDLVKLLPDAREIIPQMPEYNYVFGTYCMENLPQPKIKEKRQKAPKEVLQRKKPEKVVNAEQEEQGINETVKVLFDILKECYEQNGQKPVKYYDYIIDTSSYGNTIENMFHFSFLVRDGRAHMDLHKGEPYVKPIAKNELKVYRQSGGGNSQIITALTMLEWEMFKKVGYIQKYKNNVAQK